LKEAALTTAKRAQRSVKRTRSDAASATLRAALTGALLRVVVSCSVKRGVVSVKRAASPERVAV